MWRGPRLPREPDVWESAEEKLTGKVLPRKTVRQLLKVARRGLDLPGGDQSAGGSDGDRTRQRAGK